MLITPETAFKEKIASFLSVADPHENRKNPVSEAWDGFRLRFIHPEKLTQGPSSFRGAGQITREVTFWTTWMSAASLGKMALHNLTCAGCAPS
jgi:hypothetical protein